MPTDSAFNIPHSPIAALGSIVLLVAFLVAAYAFAAGVIGNVQHRRRLVSSSVYSLYGFFALMVIASALLIYAFVTHDYTIKYVARYSDTSMPLWYKITAYWGGLDGSLMFWVFVLSAFSAAAVKVNYQRHRDMIGYVVATVMAVQLFFLALLIYSKNPFATFLTTPPLDGEGLNPLLQNYWMVIHPPSLYLGYVSATVPFAFAVAAMASGRLDDLWLHSIRVWVMICWFFLSLGLILGGRWAYEELGWGGYWAWDPVENAGLLPWFTATAYLHSAIIQEQRGMMKGWNLMLVIITFFLTIFGTFMTRSGIVQSVHAFGEDNQLALLFVLFMGVTMIVALGLLIYRLPKLRSAGSFESFVSREFAFLLNNWILLGCAVFVLFVTMFPTMSEAMGAGRLSVGVEFFNRSMTPLGLVLLFLAGAAPLLAWRRTTREKLYSQFLFPTAFTFVVVAGLAIFWPATRVKSAIFAEALHLPVSLLTFGLVAFVLACIGQEFWRGLRVRMRQTGGDPFSSLAGLVLSKRRKYGGYIIHLGMAVLFFGFAGKAYETMEDRTIQNPGESFRVGDYFFVFKDLKVEADDHKRSVTANVSLYSGRIGEDDKRADLTPARWVYVKGDDTTTEVAIDSGLKDDVYLVLTGYDEKTHVVNFRIYINPLINWVWLGFGFLAFGTFICLIPQGLVDTLTPARRSRAGKATETAVLILIIGGVSFGLVQMASAAEPPSASSAAPSSRAPLEHLDEAATGPNAHGDGEGYAHLCRPTSTVADKLMKELICTCGGCTRETLYECKCAFAAKKRCAVNEQLASIMPPGTESDAKVRDAAYTAVVDTFIQDAGGEHVLATPRNKLTWVIPYVAIAGGLGLLYVVSRRWVRRGRADVAAGQAAVIVAANDDDDAYAERLDDELRDQD